MSIEYKNLYNVNVGILGHVDSGKTSLVAALSTTLSTAALDKHPQSKERGITLDLGFSSFILPAPPSLSVQGFDGVQFTLVDCPGHASLIRTVVGGALIMDMMMLIIDVTKGIQTQTAECIVIGEITTDSMIVVLNKIDLLDPEKREKYIKKARKLVSSTLAVTKFANCPIVAVSALRPSSSSYSSVSAAETPPQPMPLIHTDPLHQLKETLVSQATTIATETQQQERPRSSSDQGVVRNTDSSLRPHTSSSPPFLFFIDHCFAIKGQGTVLTGTVARGQLKVGDTIELPALKVQKKVKSMQMFRKPVQSCREGDRVGLCVTQLEASSIERGIAAQPGSIPTFSRAIAAVEKVRFYPGELKSSSKMHVIVGHHTVMGRFTFFSSDNGNDGCFNFNKEYAYQEELVLQHATPVGSRSSLSTTQWFALIEFDEAVTAPPDSLIIGARLDADLNAASCRIACSGHLVHAFDSHPQQQLKQNQQTTPTELQKLKVYKIKNRQGVVERIENDGRTAICRGMFGKESDLSKFLGMTVWIGQPPRYKGVLEGTFGKSGKFKVRFDTSTRVGAQIGQQPPLPIMSSLIGHPVVLEFKRFLFDPDKRRITQ